MVKKAYMHAIEEEVRELGLRERNCKTYIVGIHAIVCTTNTFDSEAHDYSTLV